jgi:hypothetical protein
MDAFKMETITTLMAEIDQYQRDAGLQTDIAKSDFVALIQTTILKIHDLDLDDIEKHELKKLIIA